MIDETMLRKTIAANVVRLRKARGFSQQKLAEVTGVGRITIAKIETEKLTPGAAILFTIADALGVSADQLRQISEAAASRSA